MGGSDQARLCKLFGIFLDSDGSFRSRAILVVVARPLMHGFAGLPLRLFLGGIESRGAQSILRADRWWWQQQRQKRVFSFGRPCAIVRGASSSTIIVSDAGGSVRASSIWLSTRRPGGPVDGGAALFGPRISAKSGNLKQSGRPLPFPKARSVLVETAHPFSQSKR